jgi:hypothetical protein
MCFQNFEVIPTKKENYVWHAEGLMKESWEAGSSTENRGPLYPLVLMHGETSEDESNLGVWW